MATNPIGGGQIGRSVPRLEAREKVTGRAEYTHLMRLPNMLHGKIFRSTVAHGRIKSIDTSAAKKIPGVFRVITAEDVVRLAQAMRGSTYGQYLLHVLEEDA